MKIGWGCYTKDHPDFELSLWPFGPEQVTSKTGGCGFDPDRMTAQNMGSRAVFAVDSGIPALCSWPMVGAFIEKIHVAYTAVQYYIPTVVGALLCMGSGT